MNKNTANYLKEKTLNFLSQRGFNEFGVNVFDTSEDMLKYIWPINYKKKIKQYNIHMRSKKYQVSFSSSGKPLFYRNVYMCPSLNSQMGLFGLATRPRVSVTYESQSMWDFTFTILHEIAHIFYQTSDELVCNNFAMVYNKLLWGY